MSHLLLLLLSATAVSPRGAVASAHPLASEAAAAVLRDGGNADRRGRGGGAGAVGGGAGVVRPGRWRLRAGPPRARGADGGARLPRGRAGGGSTGHVRGSAPRGRAEPLARRRLGGGGPGRGQGIRRAGPQVRDAPVLAPGRARRPDRGARVRGGSRTTSAPPAAGRRCLSARPAAARAFLVRGADGAPAVPAPGTRLRQPELARTLRLLGRDPEAFYRGPLAAAIVRAARADGGAAHRRRSGRLPHPRADSALGHLPRLPDRLHAAPVLGRRDRHRPAPGARARGPARRRATGPSASSTPWWRSRSSSTPGAPCSAIPPSCPAPAPRGRAD